MDGWQEMPQAQDVTEMIQTAFAGLRISSSQTKGLSALDSLRLCFARVKINPSWDILCKSFILCNLLDMDSLHMLVLFYSEANPQVHLHSSSTS